MENPKDEKPYRVPRTSLIALAGVAIAVFMVTLVAPISPNNSTKPVDSLPPRYADDSPSSVLSAASRETRSKENSKPQYKADDIDFSFVEEALAIKPKIVAGINRVVRENDRCATIDTQSLNLADLDYNKKRPRFQIVCNAADGSHPFAVVFDTNDVDSKQVSFRAATLIAENAARDACEKASEEEPRGLRDISFSNFFNGNYIPHGDGKATITLAFTAKNSYGISDSYKVICWFSGLTLTEHNFKPG